MILFPDNLMAKDYELETDILKVQGPDLTLSVLPEIQVAIHKLIAAVKHYDVKRLLIDSRKSKVEISEAIYKPIVFL